MYYFLNTLGRTVFLGSTRPLEEFSIRIMTWGAGGGGQWWPGYRADNLANFLRRLYINSGTLACWSTQGLSVPVQRMLYI